MRSPRSRRTGCWRSWSRTRSSASSSTGCSNACVTAWCSGSASTPTIWSCYVTTPSSRQMPEVDHVVDVHRLLEPAELLVHEDGELLETGHVDASAGIALPVGVRQIELERSPDEACVVEVAFGLGLVRQVVTRRRDVVGKERTDRLRLRLQEFLAEPDVQ